jgi:hypothetical protein
VDQGRPTVKLLCVRLQHQRRYQTNSETPNAQRPTSNAQCQKWDTLRFRRTLLEFRTPGVGIIDLLINTNVASHIAAQLLRGGTGESRLLSLDVERWTLDVGRFLFGLSI